MKDLIFIFNEELHFLLKTLCKPHMDYMHGYKFSATKFNLEDMQQAI